MKRYLYIFSGFLLSFSMLSAQEAKLMLPIGHSLGIATAIFSPDGKRIVTSALDNTVKIWETNSGLLLANLRGHTDTVRYANYSPDGKKIVTACEDGTAKIWDANTAELLFDLKGHTDMVYYAGFSPDGKHVLTSSEDHTAKIWDASTGKLLADLTGHTRAIWECWYSPDGKKIITASLDSTARIWDAASGKLLNVLKGHTAQVQSARISPDGKLAATGSADSTAKIWDAETGKLLFDLKGHTASLSFVSFSPDGKKVLTGSDDGYAKLWDVATGKLVYSLLGKKVTPLEKNDNYYPDYVNAAHFSPDGKKILTVYYDSTVKIWDAATGKILREIKRPLEFVNSAGFSPDSKSIALALAYAHAEVWEIATGNLTADLKGRATYLTGFNYSPDGKRILATGWPGSGKLLDAETGGLVAVFPSNKAKKQEGVNASFSPDGKKIVSTVSENVAKVYDAVTGVFLFDLKGHTNSVISAWFSPDGKKIYTIATDSSARTWDASTGKPLLVLKRPYDFPNLHNSTDGKRLMVFSYPDSVVSIFDGESGQIVSEINGRMREFMNPEISPDGNKVINGNECDTAKIWDVQTGKLLISVIEPGYLVRTATFTPDMKRFIFIAMNKETKAVIARLYDAETGKLVADLKHEGSTFRYNVQFSADGKVMFTDSQNGTMSKWNAETGEYLGRFEGLGGTVYGVNFSKDQKKVLVGSQEGIERVLDAQTGKLLMELKGHTFSVYTGAFSTDEKKIVTIAMDNTAKVWDAATGQLLYTFVGVDDDDYLILDKDNHFDGTERARKLLYFTCGTELIELDQVKDQLWVPNLAERILKGETINAAKLSDLNICNLTPLIEPLEQSSTQYKFRITPRIGGLGASIVYVNGIEVSRYMPQQLTKESGNYVLAIDKKDLQKLFVSNKENVITVKGLTEKNSISSRSTSIREKANELSTVPPNLYAVAVGISDYKGEELDLKFAAKDAVDIANAVELSAKKLLDGDGKEHVFIYRINTSPERDKFPEKNSIKQVFADIASKARPNDILFIFFAGHGVMETEKNKFYFLTADASNATVTGALKDVGISTEELSDWIKPQVMKAQKRILIFDACNSGQIIKELVGLDPGGKNLLASRGDDKGKQIKAIEKLNERSGMFILSASASDQKAYEMGKYSQGALTYCLLKAIKEEPNILEDRKYLNISRWFDAAERSVGELARETGARQQPQLVSTTNFNVGVVDDEVKNKIVLPFEKPLFTRSDFRNADQRIDNLKLRNAVDKKLEDISDNSNAILLFNVEYDGANVYSISGDYKINGTEVVASLVLVKGGMEIMNKFELKGSVDNVSQMAQLITDGVVAWLNKRN